ncbi:macrophage mannose receptor 1-like [Myxocyprinus asiaticus]|uniref:macrophage mannose receptor 1-like n=1 Tax=Myxocyprinus asiaticus TaxID=70543 RepID=UPI002222B463|nr:macrophage mannose receptor 1-like [Myxocyprinus asiaticus]
MESSLLQVLFLLGVLSSSLSFRGQYILIQQKKTWAEAQAFCRENHLDLATFNNDNDRENFREDLAASNFKSDVWVGLYSLYSNISTWQWSFQDENVTFTYWSSEQPNNYGGDQNCVHFLSDATWNDYSCFTYMYCFCYDGVTNNFIFVTDKFRTWYESQSYCRQHYTDLATVRNINDQNKLQELMVSTYASVWIGLFRDFWKWSDGTNITSMKWISGQPVKILQNEACAYANSEGETGNGACSDPLPFVCNNVMRKIIVRVELKSDRNVTDPQIQDFILQQIQQKLKQRGMTADAEVTWKFQAVSQVFHEKENYTREHKWEDCDSYPDDTVYPNETWSY